MRKPCAAPTLAADITANNAIGAAWVKLRSRPSMSSGIAKIDPPAPVRANIKPTTKPNKALMSCISFILFLK